MRTFTLEELKKSACAKLNQDVLNKKVKRVKEKSTAVIWLDKNLVEWCKEKGLELKCDATGCEHRFDPARKWRFDYAIIDLKIAIEMEGIFSAKSRHTSVTGYSKDTEKYSRAAILGWKVLRYTALNYRNVIKDLNEIV